MGPGPVVDDSGTPDAETVVDAVPDEVDGAGAARFAAGEVDPFDPDPVGEPVHADTRTVRATKTSTVLIARLLRVGEVTGLLRSSAMSLPPRRPSDLLPTGFGGHYPAGCGGPSSGTVTRGERPLRGSR